MPPKLKSNGTVVNREKDSKENEGVIASKENEAKVPKENEVKKEKDAVNEEKKDFDNNGSDDNDDDGAEYVNVQELKRQYSNASESSQETEAADKKKDHGLYEPAEYANLAAIQESIHAKKQVRENLLILYTLCLFNSVSESLLITAGVQL